MGYIMKKTDDLTSMLRKVPGSYDDFVLSKEKSKIYTIEDIEQLPEGERRELVDGKLYDMAAPSVTHQRIAGNLYARLLDYFSKKKGKCEPFIAPFAVYLSDEGRNYLEPDVVVVCDPKKIDEKGCHGAPDIVIEVASESSQRMDYKIKHFKYRSAGVREYWIINPKHRVINTYFFEQEDEDRTGLYSFDEEVFFAVYPELGVRLSDFV